MLARNQNGQFTQGQRKVNQFGWSLVFTETHKECRKCNQIKLHSEFHKETSPGNKYGLAYWCKECACSNSLKHHARRAAADPSYKKAKRSYYIQHKHGLTLQEYEAKLASQNYLCAICGVKLATHGQGTHLDHDHKTGLLRAFLCTNCNRGLGCFHDSMEKLTEAIEYLRLKGGSNQC